MESNVGLILAHYRHDRPHCWMKIHKIHFYKQMVRTRHIKNDESFWDINVIPNSGTSHLQKSDETGWKRVTCRTAKEHEFNMKLTSFNAI